MQGSIARPNRPMSPRKAKLEAERRAFIESELSKRLAKTVKNGKVKNATRTS